MPFAPFFPRPPRLPPRLREKLKMTSTSIPKHHETLRMMNLRDESERKAAKALNASELAAAHRAGLLPSEYLKTRNELRAKGEISV